MATLRAILDRRANPAKHAPLEHVPVRGKWVDISLPAIRRFLYGADTDATRTPITPEFDYRWKLVKDNDFQRESVEIEHQEVDSPEYLRGLRG